jgi:hypothetical protein
MRDQLAAEPRAPKAPDLADRKVRALAAQVSQVEPVRALFGERADEVFRLVTGEESFVLAATGSTAEVRASVPHIGG